MIKLSTTAALLAALALPFAASAEPLNEWETVGPGYDCAGNPYNPVRPDGTRNPYRNPKPGTASWDAQNVEHESCTDQRDWDTRDHPYRNYSTTGYGIDPHRDPARFEGVRWHYEEFSDLHGNQIPDVPSAEIFRPCSNAPGDCPNLPAGLPRFDPPYPVVLFFHGVIAQKAHHRFNTEVWAENGYMAIGVNGTVPDDGSPNVQRTENGDDVLRWLGGETTSTIGADGTDYAEIADLDRVAFTGHSMGGAASLSYQGDPRVHAIIAFDAGDAIAANNCADGNPCTPIMYERTDGGFATPNGTRYDYPTNRDRGLPTYTSHKARGMDVFHMTARATVHTDWNGYGTGLAGNRYAELTINWHALGWLDRHLRGKLAFDSAGNVKTYQGRTEAQERAFRQGIAQSAFDHLARRFFDASLDKHNISMGKWDTALCTTIPPNPDQFCGNVPYQMNGLSVLDRYSELFRGYCKLSVPNYEGGGTGAPGDPVAPVHVADTGPGGDLHDKGCPVLY
jgi:pimeloyl-ACP methyl ester carboxylesterase